MYKVNTGDTVGRCNHNINKLNILIVDDDELPRESLKDIVKMRDHNVTTLDEGLKCVNRCNENKYDVIFMDYHIGDLDDEVTGVDITKLVNECFDHETKVYAYTGDNSTEAIKAFKKNNLQGAFIKPVSPSLIYEFLEIIEKNPNNKTKLSTLAMKNKNFIYFKK